jgi:hypothetical protein
MRNFHLMQIQKLAWSVGCLLLVGAGIAGSESQILKRLAPKAEARKDTGLDRAIEKVRKSFLERDTDRLEDCFGNRKVYVSLRSRTREAGYYTRSQLHFIFDKVFRDLQTRSFEYSPRDITISDDGRAYFGAEWTYVVLGADMPVIEQLRFVFEKEKDRWLISEIKTSSR